MPEITSTRPVNFRNEALGIELHGMLYEGKPVFFAVEVATSLGYENPHQALKYNCNLLIKLNSLQCRELNLDDRPKGIILLTEPDLYRLILRSKLPSAERVQDWVCEEVLPSIRQTGNYHVKSKAHRDEGSGLPEFRQAKAMQIRMEIAEKTFGWATLLSPASRQAIIAGLINPLAGSEVIPLPVLTEKLYTASETGRLFDVSANKIGRIANDNGMKTDEYGEYHLDKSKYCDKQVQSFRYNNNAIKAIKKFRDILTAEQKKQLSALPKNIIAMNVNNKYIQR